MKTIQTIQRVKTGHWVGDGFPVRSLFSPGEAEAFSPFLLLDYLGPVEFAPSDTPRGVGEHPHRGFETVTLLFQGEVEHRDSAGNAGKIRPGDVQWMTAASGVVHEELHSREFTRQGGVLEGVQLWVNLPAAQKRSAPRYQALNQASIPVVALPDGAGTLRVVAGAFQGAHGPAQTVTELNLWDVRLETGATTLEVPEGHTLILALLSGAVTINGSEEAQGAATVLFNPEGTQVRLEATSPAHLLVLSGVPIPEPIVSQGPFVMNTRQEISQAIRDYQLGKMGRLA